MGKSGSIANTLFTGHFLLARRKHSNRKLSVPTRALPTDHLSQTSVGFGALLRRACSPGSEATEHRRPFRKTEKARRTQPLGNACAELPLSTAGLRLAACALPTEQEALERPTSPG
ncbi:hypothetical protein H920_13213 [Fukomys damarensis]|uniref:Uncharacterized protein n=1 Tax=Fukomys damarensis TaxID=885580 RepID=A0A091D356_FUKDA|nr:hypothetical protein H920_13213 [Fukomys damarensis]